jgi:hypothetical protein
MIPRRDKKFKNKMKVSALKVWEEEHTATGTIVEESSAEELEDTEGPSDGDS